MFADRTSCAKMQANQLRLYFSSFACCLLQALRRPCHRARAPRSRWRRTGRARAHPPVPGWHDPRALLTGGLAGTPRSARTPTARTSDAIPRRIRAKLPTPPARRAVAGGHRRPQASTVHGAGGVVASDPARTERRWPAHRAHQLGAETAPGVPPIAWRSASTSPPAPTAAADCAGSPGAAFGGPPSGGRLRTSRTPG